MSLLEIDNELVKFRLALETSADEGGEVDAEANAELEAWFADLQDDIESKADNYAAFVRELSLRAAVRREEKERLEKRILADENLAKRLKSRLLDFMLANDIPKIETRRFRIRYQKNGGKVPLELTKSAAEMPAEFQRTEIVLDEPALREALTAGKDVDGAKLLPRGSHLRIE